MRNGGFPGACLPEEDEYTLGFGVVDPITDVIQERRARSWKTTFDLIAEAPT